MTRTTCELSRHQLSTINLRERTININVTYSACVKTRRHGICSNKRNFHWKKCFPFPKSPQRSICICSKGLHKTFWGTTRKHISESRSTLTYLHEDGGHIIVKFIEIQSWPDCCLDHIRTLTKNLKFYFVENVTKCSFHSLS